MKTEKLFQLLAPVGNVSNSEWNMVMKIVDYIKKGSVDIKEKKWNDDFKEQSKHYPLDLSEVKTWSTFDHTCIELNFYFEEEIKKLKCDVSIYDGENLHGRRTQLRFTATLLMPDEFIHELKSDINWNFERFLENAYMEHLKKQKKDWIDNLRTEFLNLE